MWLVRLLSLVATAGAAYLYTRSSGDGVAGCDGLADFDCSAALASRWSQWLVVPVSLVGAICYGGIFVGSLLVGRRWLAVDAAGWRLLELLTPAALGAALWFTALQLSGSAPTCLYCLLVHACGVAIAGLVFWRRWSLNRTAAGAPGLAPLSPVALAPGSSRPAAGAAPPPSLGLPTLGGVTIVAALVLVQIMMPPEMRVIDAASLEGEFSLDVPAADVDSAAENSAVDSSADSTDTSPLETQDPDVDVGADAEPAADESPQPAARRRAGGSREVTLLGGKLTLDTYKYPLLGSPDADYVIAEMMDYGCPHCREFHHMLHDARERYGRRLAIVVLPVPLDILCNKNIRKARPTSRESCKLARLAVAFAKVEPEKFELLHDYLLKGEKKPSFSRALIWAKEHTNDRRLSDALRDNNTEQQVQRFIALKSAIGSQSLPSQIVGNKILQGLPTSLDVLCTAWERELGIMPNIEVNLPPY